MITTGTRIKLIKEIRAATGWGLAEAKDLADKILQPGSVLNGLLEAAPSTLAPVSGDLEDRVAAIERFIQNM